MANYGCLNHRLNNRISTRRGSHTICPRTGKRGVGLKAVQGQEKGEGLGTHSSNSEGNFELDVFTIYQWSYVPATTKIGRGWASVLWKRQTILQLSQKQWHRQWREEAREGGVRNNQACGLWPLPRESCWCKEANKFHQRTKVSGSSQILSWHDKKIMITSYPYNSQALPMSYHLNWNRYLH